MKKFVKGSLITAGILAAIGCVFTLTGILTGGRSFVRYYHEGYMSEKLDDIFSRINFGVGKWHFGWRDDEELVINGSSYTDRCLTGNSYTNPEMHQSVDGISNLNLTLGAGSFVLKGKETNDGVIDIYVQGHGKCDYLVKDDTFYVEGFKGIKSIGTDLSENVITLVVPKGMGLEEVNVEVGAGSMEVFDLRIDEFEAEVGAGELKMTDVQIREFEAEIGAGRLEAENVSTQNAEISTSVGECIYQGTILENLDAECDMGNMEFVLSGNEEDHNYEIECSMGNIDMDDMSFSAMAAEKKINNGAKGNFDISCNMGNISIHFEE